MEKRQITYKEQERKIHEAYIKDDILPYDPEFCFCGTLAKRYGHKWESEYYSMKEFERMEKALLTTIDEETYNVGKIFYCCVAEVDGYKSRNEHPNYENALFNGMVAALEVLKNIHKNRGEIIDTEPVFKKRSTRNSFTEKHIL